MTLMLGHAYVEIDHPLAQFALVSGQRAKRLVVFVHGWKGSANDSWGEFPTRPPRDEWWGEADLLFLEYDSINSRAASAADRIRQHLSAFYPRPNVGMLKIRELQVRADIETPYEELILVGHSLGGLVLRLAKVDAVTEWENYAYDAARRNVILDGALRLFSPASAGFDPTGRLGAVQAFPGLRWLLAAYLAYGSATKDLGLTKELLAETQTRTETYGTDPELRKLLEAYILWADKEKVVKPQPYKSDRQWRTADDTDHRSVCKPHPEYQTPFVFVRTGDIA